MDDKAVQHCTAFEGCRCVASGNIAEVAGKVKEIIDREEKVSILIFDDDTGRLVEVDFRGTKEDVLRRLEMPSAGIEIDTAPADPGKGALRGPGRPRLGVVSREVTLLPRHWEWLNSQPGGASVALRKLVEQARRANRDKDTLRQSQESTYRFMSAMAGDLPGFEEASRALFAGDQIRFSAFIESWPVDIRGHVLKISEAAFRNTANGAAE